LKRFAVIAAFALSSFVVPCVSSAQEVSLPVATAPAPVAAPIAAPAAPVPVNAAPIQAGLPVQQTPAEVAVAALAKENAQLQEKLRNLESCSISSGTLAAKNCRRIKEIAADIRVQRQGMADFQGYVAWMSANIAGYSKYISAGSVAAGFAKVLPIPYAGQASLFTKFVSNATLSLSAASVSINNYLATSVQFLARADELDPDGELNPREVSDLVRFADRELLTGMVEVQERLTSTSELSASSLSFLESLNHYMGSTDEYWMKTKALVKSGDDKKEKSFLSASTTTLRDRALAFNAKFKLFGETVQKDAPLIKSLVAYDDLIREIDLRFAKLK
jgi:hypothetical protein